ncbi:hypothetical protein ACHAWX_001986 [Stephanocyclus meneghinianus]
MSNKSSRSSKELTVSPIAIIHGTHLILLPDNLDNPFPPPPSGEAFPSDAGDYVVPAIPLKDVSRLIGAHYISCLDDDDAENVAAVSEGCDSDNDEEIIEKMCLNASDTDYVGSLIRPINLTRRGGNSSSSSVSIRVWREEQAYGASTYWSDDNECLDVHLPVWGDSLDGNYVCEHEDVKIYGDEYDDILQDYNNSASKSGINRTDFQIENAGSCLIADFLGIGGYQQMLVLPQLAGDGSSTLHCHTTDSDEDTFLNCGHFMRKILSRSFLTDGYGILLSKQLERLHLKSRNNDLVVMKLPMLELDVDFRNSEKSLKANSVDTIKPTRKKSPTRNDENNHGSSIEVDNDNTSQDMGKSQQDPPWLKTLEKTIEHRISKKANEASQVERSHQISRELVTLGRNTLHKAIRCGFDNTENSYTEGVEDPQVVRLRYGVHPRSSTDASGVSVVMDLEVDVYLPEVRPHNNQLQPAKNLDPSVVSGTEKQSSHSSNVLHEFHLSCLLSDDYPVTQPSVHGVSCEQIRTVSGSVPTFQPGECVTILASVYFTNLDINLPGVHGECSTVELTIQGYWVDGVSTAKRLYWNPADRQNRQGAIMCILQLPEEDFFLSTTSTTASGGGRCIHHEIDFVANATNQEKYVSMAIFENREPHTLTIDISSSVPTFQDPKIWKDLVSSLNARIGLNSHIDLFWKTGDPRLRLVVFGSNLEERAGGYHIIVLLVTKM